MLKLKAPVRVPIVTGMIFQTLLYPIRIHTKQTRTEVSHKPQIWPYGKTKFNVHWILFESPMSVLLWQGNFYYTLSWS
jgi:hypothetical protein